MVIFTRTATIVPGKTVKAMAFAANIAEVATKVGGTKVSVMAPIASGTAGLIAWRAEFENLGAMEKAIDKLLGNTDYMSMLSQAEGLFVAGGGQDIVWRDVQAR